MATARHSRGLARAAWNDGCRSRSAAPVAHAEQIVDADVPAVNLFELPVENVTRSDITGYGAYAEPVTYYEYLHPAR